MPPPRLDMLAIGNAIVDVIAPADEALVAQAGLVKGSMRLVGEAEALALHARMTGATETSGGSAANTAVGVAALGGTAGFVGLAGADRLGAMFTDELRAGGVVCTTPPDADGSATARCLVMVTADGQRSMCTFPGAAHRLAVRHIDPAQVADAALLFLEGYLWDSAPARAAMEHAIGIARQAGRKVAVTPSDIACIARQGERFRDLIAHGAVDMLFLNDAELAALAGDAGALAERVELVIVTHGAHGASVLRGSERISVPALAVARVVDTTGAGDLFAAGFLYGRARGLELQQCLRIGTVAAAEVISHFGARPKANLAALI